MSRIEALGEAVGQGLSLADRSSVVTLRFAKKIARKLCRRLHFGLASVGPVAAVQLGC